MFVFRLVGCTTRRAIRFNLFSSLCRVKSNLELPILKMTTRIFLFLAAIFAFVGASVSAQPPPPLTVKIAATNENSVRITGKTARGETVFGFVDSYANARNLIARIENFELRDANENSINSRRNAAGAFIGDAAANDFRYTVNLNLPKNAGSAAHVSWLDNSARGGVLMLNDLLPESLLQNSVKITFELPANWRVASGENQTGANQFAVAQPEKAVFMIGDLQQIETSAGKTTVNLARLKNDWSFTEAEAADTARAILLEYQRLFKANPIEEAQILLAPLPQSFGGESWAAETRGTNVLVMSAVSVFKSRALAKLHEQLRHELFHLWIPNALKLSGDYAWFYEGFAIYQAAKTAVKLRQIRFEDFLDALARAFDIAKNSGQNTISLLDASRLRFGADNSEFVYAKGMIVAFLCDINLLDKSNGKRTIAGLFEKLFERGEQTAANAAILNLLKSEPALQNSIPKTIETPGAIDWQADLERAGLRNAARTSLTVLAVQNKLNGRQRKILADLGMSLN